MAHPAYPTVPIAPLLEVVDGNQSELARQIGVGLRAVTRWCLKGVPEPSADRAACALGYHPAELWGDAWWEAVA